MGDKEEELADIDFTVLYTFLKRLMFAECVIACCGRDGERVPNALVYLCGEKRLRYEMYFFHAISSL